MFKYLTFLLIFTSVFCTSLSASTKNFKVSFDPDYAPFSYIENQKPQGLLIDLWKYWAEQNNYSLEFINGKNWSNALELVKNKKVDFFLGTNVYENWMKGSDCFYKTKTSAFIHQHNSKGFDKQSSYLVGIIAQDYEEIIKNNFPNSQIIIYEDYKSLIDDLTNNKIDLIYDDKIAIEFFILKNRIFHEVKALDIINEKSDIQAISYDTNLVKIFNEGLKNLTYENLRDIESLWILNKEDHYFKNSALYLTKEEKYFLKNTTLNVSVSKAWKPFAFASNINAPTGISQEIWELISKKINLKSEYKIYDKFTNQLDAIKNKTADIIYSTGKTKQREEYSLFTKPYVSFPISITTLKDENFIEDMSYLKDKIIAVGENFTAHKLLKEKYPDFNFLLVSSIKNGLEAVRKKNAYAYLDIKPSLTYNINKYQFNDLKISGNTGLNFDLRIMIRDDYKILQAILNKTINSLSDQEIHAILNRWDNIQFERETNYENIWIFIFIAFTIIIVSIYINQLNVKRNKALAKLVDDRTLELKMLNENLEQKIDFKTRELRRVNYLLDEAQKIAHLGSFQYHITRNELYWSEELYKIFGYFIDEVVPSVELLLDCVHIDDKKFVNEQLKIALSNDKKTRFEFRIQLKDKNIKYLQFTSKITKFDINNTPIMMIGTILDLTKIKILELEKMEKDSILAQQTKMAAMGEMLENIAHQWRQPLSAISTVSTGIQLQLELNSEIPKDLLLENVNSINEHSQYLSKTIDDFRNFFNPNKVKLQFNIKDSIEKSLYLVEGRLRESNIQIIKNIDDANIYSLENELIQIFLNILNNAIDACNINEVSPKYVFINVKNSKKNILIDIIDNAGGIPLDIIGRIFEPYFTTKYKSQGTGIGLYMSNEIVSKHLHGTLTASNDTYDYENKKFTGAKFTITLPITTA